MPLAGSATGAKVIGLVAGNGVLPRLFADAARAKGYRVVALAHEAEADGALAAHVDVLEWVKLGQLGKIAKRLRTHGAREVVMAGGIGRVRAFTQIRPDFGALQVIAKVRSFRDDGLLRAIAAYLEGQGVRVVAPTELLPEALAPEGHLAGPVPTKAQEADIALGLEVALLLGQADVGQTVVVRHGHVLALEALEGTDEAIRRGGKLGGPGACVVKLAKPGQDTRFDLPAVGPKTLDVMEESGAVLLAVEAGRSVVLDAAAFLAEAKRRGITVVGVRVSRVSRGD